MVKADSCDQSAWIQVLAQAEESERPETACSRVWLGFIGRKLAGSAVEALELEVDGMSVLGKGAHGVVR